MVISVPKKKKIPHLPHYLYLVIFLFFSFLCMHVYVRAYEHVDFFK